ncbi:MAG TPA: hypothetical protein PKH33_08255 [bacterium]|nr:hypothetical protein [bacterium]
MYEKINYIMDAQGYLYELFAATERGRLFEVLGAASFAASLFALAIAVAIIAKSKPADIRGQNASRHDILGARYVFSFAAVFSLLLFLVRGMVSYEYMDFAYYYEGEFTELTDFFANRAYLSNIHRPGYMLISWLIRELLGGSRDAYIIINLAAMTASAPLAFKLLSRNVNRYSAMFGTAAFVMSPMSAYSVYRFSPYWIVAFLFIALVYSYVVFCETGSKKSASAMVASIFLLPFFHVLTFYGIAAFFAAAALDARKTARNLKGAGWLFFAVAAAAAGSCLFNLSHLVVFRTEIDLISAPSTARLGVYQLFPGGNAEFLSYCLKVMPNLFMSFVSDNAVSAVVIGVLCAIGAVGLIARGSNGAMFVLLGVAACSVLTITNALNHSRFDGYPMSYRHLQMMSFFFVYNAFFALDAIGRLFSAGKGFSRSVFCFIAMIVFAANLPGFFGRLRSPDMTSAMRYVYGNVREYDGIIPGNIYFQNEYHTHFLSQKGQPFQASLVYLGGDSREEAFVRNYNQWAALRIVGGKEPNVIMMNIAPLSIISHEALLKSNYIGRVWHFDTDTRFLGAFPDFSGKYEKDIRNALKRGLLLETKRFDGVTVSLYAMKPEPVEFKDDGCFDITAGENDYYFVRGAEPDVRVASDSRHITEQMNLLFFVAPQIGEARIAFELEQTEDSAKLVLQENESKISYLPGNDDRNKPVYNVERKPGLNHFLFTFEKFGRATYRRITICDSATRRF